MNHKYSRIAYTYGIKKVETLKVYENPLTLGDNLFWYCVRCSDGSLAVVRDALLFDTIDECWKAEEERAKGMKEFFDTIPKRKDGQDGK